MAQLTELLKKQGLGRIGRPILNKFGIFFLVILVITLPTFLSMFSFKNFPSKLYDLLERNVKSPYGFCVIFNLGCIFCF